MKKLLIMTVFAVMSIVSFAQSPVDIQYNSRSYTDFYIGSLIPFKVLKTFTDEQSTGAEKVSKIEKTNEETEESEEAIHATGFVLLALIILITAIWLIHRHMDHQIEKYEVEEKELKELNNNVTKCALRLNNFISIMNQGVILNLSEAASMKGLTDPLTHLAILKDANTQQKKDFLTEFWKIELPLEKLAKALRIKVSAHTAATSYLQDVGSSDIFVKDYQKYLTDDFKCIFTDDEVEALIPRTMRAWGQDIKAHLRLREELIEIMRLQQFDKIPEHLDLLENNIVNGIAKHKKIIDSIKKDDATKAQLGANAKKLIYKKAEALLSYCNEESCPKTIRDQARQGIEEVMKKAICFGGQITVNYALYTTLMQELDLYKDPYLSAKIRMEAEDTARKKREDALEDEHKKYKPSKSSNDYPVPQL